MESIDTPTFRRLLQRYGDQPRIQQVPRIERRLSREEWISQVLEPGYPVLLTAYQSRQWNENDLLQHLAHRYGDQVIETRRSMFDSPQQYLQDRGLVRRTLRDYLHELQSQPAKAAAVKYAGNQKLENLDLDELGIVLPEIVQSLSNCDPTLEVSLEKTGLQLEPPACWLGPAGATTPLHKDATDNFAYQISGTKHWTLYPVQDAVALSLTRPCAESDFALPAKSGFDQPLRCLQPGATPFSIEVLTTPGTALYLPAGWCHQVKDITTGVMINFWQTRGSFASRIPIDM